MAKSVRSKSKRFVIIGFYKRKLIFFCALIGIVLLGMNYLKHANYSADVVPVIPEGGSSEKIAVEVLSNGKLLIDGEETNQTIDYVNNELRLPIVDKPGDYFDKITITLTLPDSIQGEVKPDILAVHGVGSTEKNIVDSRTIIYEASEVSSTATVTIIASLPAGSIKPETGQAIMTNLSSVKAKAWIITGIALPIITLLVMALFLVYQYKRQKVDMPDRETSQPPMALPPAVVGALINQKVGPREIAATLIDLAQRGDIIILDRERGFAFGKGRFDQRLLGFEKLLLSKIFSEHLSSDRKEIERRINKHFYSKKMSLVSAGIYALATRLGYFKVNPQKSLAKYRLIGIFFFLLALAGFVVSLMKFKDPQYIVFFWVGMMGASLVISFTASRLPIRTIIGQEVLSNWYAFKKYLTNSEEFPYSEYNQEVFQKYLPYAIVMNCEAAWAKRFARHNFITPDWFLSEKTGLGLEDFCLSLFPIVSYVSRSLSAIREPGFE